MGRAGLQPDGATYSVLHGMWLRLGNLPQAVGALAQAKQRAAQSHARSAGGGFRDRIAAADSTDDAASSLPIGEPLWDQVLRDEEIGRHLRSGNRYLSRKAKRKAGGRRAKIAICTRC